MGTQKAMSLNISNGSTDSRLGTRKATRPFAAGSSPTAGREEKEAAGLAQNASSLAHHFPERTSDVAVHLGQSESKEAETEGRKLNDASAASGEPLDGSRVGVFQERGAGTASSSTLQPVKTTVKEPDLALSRPTPSVRVQPIPGQDLVEAQAQTSGAGNPDYESIHETQGLPTGQTNAWSNRSGTAPSKAASSSGPRRTEETPRIPHPELGIQEESTLVSQEPK